LSGLHNITIELSKIRGQRDSANLELILKSRREKSIDLLDKLESALTGVFFAWFTQINIIEFWL